MLIPDRPGAVGRFARRPTTDRGHMSSSKALVSRAATRTLFALLIVLDGAVAMREPLPVSTWHALEQRDWRIASTKHAKSYLFRVDKGEAGGAGICTPATVGACCGDSATRAWYVATTTKTAPWIAAAGFKHAGGRRLTSSLDSWARREPVLPPTYCTANFCIPEVSGSRDHMRGCKRLEKLVDTLSLHPCPRLHAPVSPRCAAPRRPMLPSPSLTPQPCCAWANCKIRSVGVGASLRPHSPLVPLEGG